MGVLPARFSSSARCSVQFSSLRYDRSGAAIHRYSGACIVECAAMEPRQLETFRVVMATRSMTEAAKRVYLSPAAVSLQIKRLSEELGADPFARVGNKLVPTSAATRMHQHLGALMDMLHTIREDFPLEAGCDIRPFILGTGPTTLIYQLRDPLAELQRQFPRNEILVHVGPTQNIILRTGMEADRPWDRFAPGGRASSAAQAPVQRRDAGPDERAHCAFTPPDVERGGARQDAHDPLHKREQHANTDRPNDAETRPVAAGNHGGGRHRSHQEAGRSRIRRVYSSREGFAQFSADQDVSNSG